MSQALLDSWAITLRHLAASRYYLPEKLGEGTATLCLEIENFLHHNELGLALDNLKILGNELDAPKEFWHELFLAAQDMELKEHAARIHANSR